VVVLTFHRSAALNRYPFDEAYLQRLRARDADTERHFCAYFSDLILLKLRARRIAALFDDVSQETFVRVLRTVRSPEGLRDAGALGAFVCAVCGHVIQEQMRSRKSEGFAPPDDYGEILDRDAATPETQLVIEERTRAVQAVLAKLPPRDRQLLAAIFLKEEDRDRVCEHMGVTRDYLRVLLHRAKKELKTEYLAATAPPAPGTASSSVLGKR
jgi:RNA polymerase sigma-70 factor (ECF subfamily)